jgi:CBS domain-containing protein
MLDSDVSGAPVVDEKGHLVGVLTEKDVIWKVGGQGGARGTDAPVTASRLICADRPGPLIWPVHLGPMGRLAIAHGRLVAV